MDIPFLGRATPSDRVESRCLVRPNTAHIAIDNPIKTHRKSNSIYTQLRSGCRDDLHHAIAIVSTQMPSWQLPEGARTLFIDSDVALNRAEPVLQGCLVCGIDAEWPPEQTGHAPAAALLQLACWSTGHGLTILLLVR